MITLQSKYWQAMLLRYVPWVLLAGMALALVAMVLFGRQWWLANQHQQMVVENNLPEAIAEDNHLMALHQAYQLSKLELNKKNTKKLMKALTIAEAAPDPDHRAYAQFITANLYYDVSKIEQNTAEGGSHQEAVAQIELARESYKRTIRQLPDFYDARFNLELIDRLAPPKRTQGWKGGVDGITLQPFKRNGTSMMRDNERKGLP